MADSRSINLKGTAILYASIVLIVSIIGAIIVFALNLSYSFPFLSKTNGGTFTELLFNSAVIVSTFLISLAPVMVSTFWESKKGKEKKDSPILRFLKWYMGISIAVLVVTVVCGSISIADTDYAFSTELSLLLLFIVTTGYFFLCFPIKTKQKS